MYDDDKAQLLVVGGALTGLSSAVFLAAHGVSCVVIVVVVERHPICSHTSSWLCARHQSAHGRELFCQVRLEPVPLQSLLLLRTQS
jgi:glycine/D-amino acid oxidase-like deaminating enzyme